MPVRLGRALRGGVGPVPYAGAVGSAGEHTGEIETRRLRLLPLTRPLLVQTLAAAGPFAYAGCTFTQDWAGEAADFFPLHLYTPGPETLAGSFAAVERASGQAVGWLGTKHRPKGGRVEVGYELRPAARGQGYAAEALGGLLGRLQHWPDVSTVLAETDPSNGASIRVLQKNGFCLQEGGAGRLRWAKRLAPAHG